MPSWYSTVNEPRDIKHSCLHLVSGARRTALAECSRHCDSSDSVLFLDAGVLQVFRDELAGLSASGAGLYFLAADLQAHGLQQMARDLAFDVMDDAGFVRLLCEHDHCLSWK